MAGGVDLERYKAIDFGKLALHWFLIMLGVSTAFGIAYMALIDTGKDTGDPLASTIYTVNIPLFITGVIIIAVWYIFVWKLWLKRDLIRCIQCHWGWVVMYGLVAAWNLFLVVVVGFVSWFARLPGLFSTIEDFAAFFPFVVASYMILISVIDSLITGHKRNK